MLLAYSQCIAISETAKWVGSAALLNAESPYGSDTDSDAPPASWDSVPGQYLSGDGLTLNHSGEREWTSGWYLFSDTFFLPQTGQSPVILTGQCARQNEIG